MKRLLCLLIVLLLSGCAPGPAAPVLASGERPLLALMYHSVLNDPKRQGKYVISPALLESDLVWLLENGYVSVSLNELTDFVAGRGALPDKPVLITFDDGYYNNLSYVLPLLEEYDCRAVISVVGAYAERYSTAPDPNPNYAHLSWEELGALVLSDRIELANHSWDMHGQSDRPGSARKPGESETAYVAAFRLDAMRCQEKLALAAQQPALAYAYPFGMIDPLSRPLLKEMGFTVTLTCYETISRICRGDADSLYGLGRFNRPGDMSTEAFFSAIFRS